MKNKTKILTCPMFGDFCQYCSHETTARPYTKIEKNKNNGLYEPQGLGKSIVQLGAYCNNACEWVEKMCYCPSRWLKAQPVEIHPLRK
jgi:hypothetical protein